MRPSDQLTQGLTQLGFNPSDFQVQTLLQYLDLLLQANQSINLTAIKDLSEAIDLHLLDSLTLRPWLDQLPDRASILDVGSGAGLPGIPIGIMYPHLQITLLDARSKKMKVCQNFVDQLGLDHIQTIHARIEAWQPDGTLDVVLARAVSQCNTILKWVESLPYQQLLVMKGQYPTEELANLKDKPQITKVTIPNRSETRHILDFS